MTEQRTTSQSKKNSSLVINGIHLHSKVDPHKEAEIFCDKYEKEIFSNSHHMILGLGIGYHLNELIKRLYKAECLINITVIEPNLDMIRNYQEDFPQFAEIPGLKFYTDKTEDLYVNPSFINILYKRPAILIHQTSYEANKDYYYGFLTYKPDPSISNYKDYIDPNLVDKLPSFQGVAQWNKDYIDALANSRKNNFETVFWQLFQKI